MTPRRRAKSGPLTGFFAAVWALVRRVPTGRVTTYGALSRILTGESGAARTVGWALHGLPAELAVEVPWWRVINSAGRISTSCLLHSATEQAARLAAEGVVVDGEGRVDLERYGWWGDDQAAGDHAAKACRRGAASRAAARGATLSGRGTSRHRAGHTRAPPR